MADEKIKAGDLLDPSVLKALEGINKELKTLLDNIKAVMVANKASNEEFKKDVTTKKELEKNTNLVNKSTKETIAYEKELNRLKEEAIRNNAKIATLRSKEYEDAAKARENLKKEKEAISDVDKAEAKRRGNIGKYKEDIVKAYVAIQAALMVAKAAFNVVNDAIKENETTSEFLERKIGGLGAAYDVLKSKLFGVIEGLVKSDKSSINWGKGFVAFLDGMSMGFASLFPSVRKLGDEMDNATRETEKLIAKQQDLDDLEGDRILARSISNRQLVEARDLYNKEGISLKEKKKYLEDAIKLETLETNKEIVYQSQKVANLIER